MHFCDDYRSPLVLKYNLLGLGRTSDLGGLALALGDTLLVSSLVESDEQDEVRTQKTATEKSGTLTASTVTDRRNSVLDSKVAVSYRIKTMVSAYPKAQPGGGIEMPGGEG